jgi:hypothetical protein
MDAVAVQIANTFQFGSGAKGRRGEAYHGHGKGPQGHGFPPRLEDNPDDWPCPCGLKVWARKTECPQCHGQRPMKGLEVKVQTTTHGSQPPQTQQAVGTEEDAAKVEEAKKRGQLKHIAKTIAGWPEDQKDGDFFKSMQKEAEALKASLVSSQPTDMQLLGAKEEVNATKRRVLKSEKKRDQAVKDLTIAKDEVAASRASNTAAVERLEVLEKAITAMAAGPLAEPIVTQQELEALKQMRAAKAKAGAGGEEAYRMTMAGIADWYGSDQHLQVRGRAPSAPATPEAGPGAATPRPPAAGEGMRTPTPRPATEVSPGRGTPGDPRRLGPAVEAQPAGRKRGPSEEAEAFHRKQEASLAGADMEVDQLAQAAAVPGCMTQPGEQSPKPMELDGGEGKDLSQEEQDLWARSERAREEELGLEAAARLSTAKEEAAAQEAAQGTGTAGKGRSAKEEKAARRASSRSPYRKRNEEEEGDPKALETVSEEAEAEAERKKIPSDNEEEEEEEPKETDPTPPEGGPPQDAF